MLNKEAFDTFVEELFNEGGKVDGLEPFLTETIIPESAVLQPQRLRPSNTEEKSEDAICMDSILRVEIGNSTNMIFGFLISISRNRRVNHTLPLRVREYPLHRAQPDRLRDRRMKSCRLETPSTLETSPSNLSPAPLSLSCCTWNEPRDVISEWLTHQLTL